MDEKYEFELGGKVRYRETKDGRKFVYDENGNEHELTPGTFVHDEEASFKIYNTYTNLDELHVGGSRLYMQWHHRETMQALERIEALLRKRKKHGKP